MSEALLLGGRSFDLADDHARGAAGQAQVARRDYACESSAYYNNVR
jgi:hypothetical protein